MPLAIDIGTKAMHLVQGTARGKQVNVKNVKVKQFFHRYGKEFFPKAGKQFFPKAGKEFFHRYGKQFFQVNRSGCFSR